MVNGYTGVYKSTTRSQALASYHVKKKFNVKLKNIFGIRDGRPFGCGSIFRGDTHQ
jgi:hypothetical protein